MSEYQIPAEMEETIFDQIVQDYPSLWPLEPARYAIYAAIQHGAAAAYRAGQEQAARALISNAVVEAAAQEAFYTDDFGGHLKPGPTPHTWENIPEEGRENYRTLVRAVLTIARDYGAEVNRG